MPVTRLPKPVPPTPVEGWCGWTVDPAELCTAWSGYTPAQQDTAARLATLVMWAATGRRWGPCEVTVRPCQSRHIAETYRAYPAWWAGRDYAGPMPYLDGGVWRNCGCGSGCCCRVRCEVVLPGPVSSVTQVWVNGDIVPATEYRVDVVEGTYRLVRMTGDCWPTCQDFNEISTGPNAFTVIYQRGPAVPRSVIEATELLACEFVKQISGGDCGLPPRLQSLTRQGVSAEFIVSSIDVNTFLTGINLVDMVIRAQNPSRRTRPPLILSPDAPPTHDRITVIGGP